MGDLRCAGVAMAQKQVTVDEIRLERGRDGVYVPVQRARKSTAKRAIAPKEEPQVYRLRPVRLGGLTVDVAIDQRLIPVLTGLSTLGVVVGLLVQRPRGR